MDFHFDRRPLSFAVVRFGIVRSKPETSTSERQLIVALAESGREVSLEELALWRKNGLLPPLASYGPQTAVRSYYWYETDILARAELVYDALRKHGRSEAAIISLWLHGFEVPPPRLRRAWLHRVRLASPVRIRSANDASRMAPPGKTLPDLLLSATFHAAVSMECIPDQVMPVLRRAGAGLGYVPGNRDAETQLYWRVAMAMLLALNSSDVISSASDEEMLEAQRHLHVALTFLSAYCRDESPAAVVETLGPALFLLILALLRSGQRGTVQAITDHIMSVRNKSATPRRGINQEGTAGLQLVSAPF
jgi:hypothetical protein